MIRLYTEIAENITAMVPMISLIDLYKGQLENPGMFDVTFPSVLVDLPSTDWDEHARGNQIGDGVLTVRYLSILESRTHANDPLIEMAIETLRVADDIHEAVRKHSEVLRRTSTRRYHAARITPNAYVVEHSYQIKELYERSYRTQPKPPLSLGTRIIIPSRINN